MQTLNFKTPLLEARPIDSHKGMYGHVLVVGGDQGFGGASIMAAEATMIAGAGMASLATRKEHLSAALTRRPEIMTLALESADQLDAALKRSNVLVLGPGLGQSDWSHAVFQQCITATQAMVVDADALNLLSQLTQRRVRENWVLTPHPAEAARLLAISVVDVQADRLNAAKQIQKKFGGLVVLKGAGTIVVSETEAFVCEIGNPAMSTAGMGDVLSGLIGGLLAQKILAIDAACLAVWVHARAGDLAAQKLGRHICATEIFPYIRRFW